MKAIARRFNSMPLALGAVLLLGAALLAGAFVTTSSRAASTYVPAGDDRFETTDNGETYHNFAGKPIPAGFFNTDGQATSNAYSGSVPVKGLPLPGEGNVDTIITRTQAVNTPGSTPIKISKLSLVSINPIVVSYSDRPSENWKMAVGLSAYATSAGTMTINDGGTFDSTLGVFPKFTFTRVSDGAVKVLDTGAPGYASVRDAAVAPVPCKAVDVEPIHDVSKAEGDDSARAAAAAAGCPPVRLTSSNSPWGTCGGRFCIPRPITEQELLASHNASPPGTIRTIGVAGAEGR